MKYLKIGNNLYLCQYEAVKMPEEVKPTEPTNHIWIYDRSGSMYYTLSKLVEDLIQRSKDLPIGDTLSLGWFSSEGEHNFIIKGFKISEERDYTVLENMLRKNSTTVGLTCFSEILQDTDSIIEDLSVFSNRFALCFLTDGYPVVRDYYAEETRIFEAITKIQGKIAGSLMVGYGNYYNKDLMTKMAEALGGSLCHSSDLPSFNISLENFIKDTSESENKITIQVNASPVDTIFSINGSSINMYGTNSEGVVYYTPSKKGKNYIYVLTENKPNIANGDKEITLTNANVRGGTNIEGLVKAAYAASYVLLQRAETYKALDILGVLGDKALIDASNNSFTNEEYGSTEEKIKKAMTSSNRRFLNGRDTKYLPKPDAFCLLDALMLMQSDQEAYFYPYNPNFNYTRIGAASITKDGYPKFEPQKDIKCKLSDLVWNKKLLNLSIRAFIPGQIKLKNSYKKLGFPSNRFDTYIFRNYSLVKDGFTNVETLPMSMSNETFDILHEAGMIDKDAKYKTDRIYNINLKAIPIINRSIADDRTSAAELFTNVYAEFCLTAQIKALKFLKTEIQPEKVATASYFSGLSEKQVNFLFDHGVTNNGYAPPKEIETTTDYYYANSFSIAMAKLSSLPKVIDVRNKIEASKKLTPREELIQAGLEIYEKSGKSTEEKDTKIAWLTDRIKELQKDLLDYRVNIQKTKFAIVLTKKWFDEFSNREDNSMELNGVTFTIDLGKEKINI